MQFVFSHISTILYLPAPLDMSKLPVTVGQVLKGKNGLYKITEALKTNTVFKAAILGSTLEEIPRGARQLSVYYENPLYLFDS